MQTVLKPSVLSRTRGCHLRSPSGGGGAHALAARYLPAGSSGVIGRARCHRAEPSGDSVVRFCRRAGAGHGAARAGAGAPPAMPSAAATMRSARPKSQPLDVLDKAQPVTAGRGAAAAAEERPAPLPVIKPQSIGPAMRPNYGFSPIGWVRRSE